MLSAEQRFIIPTFQRDYEWTKDGQWKLLFEDLESVADRLGAARARAVASGTKPSALEATVSPHFLGAVVCDSVPHAVGELVLWAVVDGQQRMTTLQLLARGVLDVLLEQSSTRIPRVRKILENPDEMVKSPHEVHKLWPRRKDREVWPAALADGLVAETRNEHLYLQARRYFAAQTRRAVGGAVPLDSAASPADLADEEVVSVDTVLARQPLRSPADRLDDLVDGLLELFRMVVIELGATDDAQVIFEVLNGRQTPLSASDLVKNLLFLRGELADEEQLELLYDKYWAPFDDRWWKKRVGTGHAARDRRDVLLSVWLTAASGEEASVGHLYGEVREYLSGSDRKTEDVLAELHEYGKAYATIYRHGETNPDEEGIGLAYDRLNLLNVTTVIPLLAWLRTLPPTQLDPVDHQRAVLAVESWVVRRMLLGINTRGYGQAFTSVLKDAQAAGADSTGDVAAAVVTALAAAPNTLVWPTDDQVVAAFAVDNFYRFAQSRIRMVLGAIDARLRHEDLKSPPGTFAYDILQIEHVMPQGWGDHWPLPERGSSDAANEPLARLQRDAAVQRIGNLTLVTGEFNRNVSNLGWIVKQAEFSQQPLKISAQVAGKETWDESQIAERGRVLAEVACRIWPGPPAVVSVDFDSNYGVCGTGLQSGT